MLCAEQVSVTLAGTQVLHGVDMIARPGAVTCIVGPNGSGKTTLLRALTGEIAHGGRVTLDGDDIRAIDPVLLAERRAVLPQAAPMAFPFNVHEVVRLGVTGRLALGGQARHLPDRALEAVGLAGFGGRMFQQLSGGQQARVHLARVLAQVWVPVVDGQPRWLLLDEPVAALDIAHQLQVIAIARDFAAAGGGVVAVMHDLNLTAMLAHHVVLIQDGRILAAGSPDRVLSDDLLSRAYGCALRVNTPPPRGGPFLLPQAAA